MFKNFDKVFRFTFKNIADTKGYKTLTIILAVVLFVAPIATTLIGYGVSLKDDDELKPCDAEYIYVVNESAPDADYNMLNYLGIEGYTDIKYANSKSVEEALAGIKDRSEKKSFVIEITREDNALSSRIILPDDSEIVEDTAEHYEDFMSETGGMFTIISSGISMSEVSQLSKVVDHEVYNVSGYDKGTSLFDDKDAVIAKDNEAILPVFNILFVLLTVFALYMMILVYGSSITQSVVEEKSSKLMDTMLISIRPEAMIMGKFLGVLAAAFLQLGAWLLGLIGGGVISVILIGKLFPVSDITVINFVKSFDTLELFDPLAVVIAVITIILGILFYTSIAAMCGAISGTREEAASNQTVFIVLLIISFYIVLFGGVMSGKDVALWQYILPFTSAMVLPAGICLGTVSKLTAAIGLIVIIAATTGFIALAGKLYKMMALYKGNKVNVVKALKMLAGK